MGVGVRGGVGRGGRGGSWGRGLWWVVLGFGMWGWFVSRVP